MLYDVDGTNPRAALVAARPAAVTGSSIAVMTVYRRASASRVIVAGADGPEHAQEGLVGPEFFKRRTRRAIPQQRRVGHLAFSDQPERFVIEASQDVTVTDRYIGSRRAHIH